MPDSTDAPVAAAPPRSIDWRREWPWPATVAALLLLVYAWSSPGTVALEDDGLFVMASRFDGVAHPPGYPLFTWLGHLASSVPLGSVAWRVHLLSGLFGALACGVLWAIVRSLVPSAAAASAAALAFGGSAVFWSQAIVAEVYTLNVLLSLLLFLALLHGGRPERRPSRGGALGVGVLYGLGLSNHWPLLVLFTPALALLAWPRRGDWRALLPPLAAGVLLGLLPYLRMVWRSQAGVEVSFLGPLDDWGELWSVIRRSVYADADAELGVTAADRWAFARFQAGELVAQLTAVGLSLAVLGGAALRHRPRVLAALLAGLAGTTLPLLFLLSRHFDHLNMLVYRVYPLPAYALLAIGLGVGLHAVLERLARHAATALARGARRLLPVLIAALPFAVHAPGNLRHDYDWAERYATAILARLPADAALLVADDVDTFPVGYVHHVAGVRPDVALYGQSGTVFARRLFDPSGTPPAERVRRTTAFVRDAPRPVCFVNQTPQLDAEPTGVVDRGLFKCYADEVPVGRALPHLTRPLFDAYRALARTRERDPWTRMEQLNVDAHMVPVLVGLLAGFGDAGGVPRAEVASALERAAAHPPGVLALLRARRGIGRPVPAERALALLEAVGRAPESLYTTELRVAYLRELGGALLALGQRARAEAAWLNAVALRPQLSNGAVQALVDLYLERGEPDAVAALAARYPSLGIGIRQPGD